MFPTYPRCCYKEIIPILKMKKIYNPPFLARSQFTVYALGRKTFIELAIIVLVDGGMHMKISRVS